MNLPSEKDSPAEAQGSPSPDPFAEDDPLADTQTDPDFDDDFDALGFDTSFAGEDEIAADDDTPPGGIYVGEGVQMLDASAIGRALAEAGGESMEVELPDLEALQQGLVGIDIGASAAVVARFNAEGTHEVVPNEDDDLATPAQIFFDDDGEQLVGREARELAPSAPDRAVVNLKQAISDPNFSRDLGDGKVDAEQVLVLLLRRLLEDVKTHTGEPATHLALAAPAWFGEEQRTILRQAAEDAKVELVGITEEALAAAVPYSLRLPDLNPRRAVVVDLGHAAASVAIVHFAAGDIELLAQGSRRELGSYRWDQLLTQEVARKFRQAHDIDPLEDPGAAVDLRLRAEDAKRALSERARYTLVCSCQGKTLKVGFTRRAFEEAARPLLGGVRKLADKVRKEAGIQAWSELDALIVTGGGSRMPSLRKMLAKETGLEPERGISPEDAVAVGALYWGIGERHRQSTQ